MRADDHVDLSLDELCESSIRRGRVAPGGHLLETEMRQTDDQLGAALAKFTRAPSNDLDLVESANAEVDVAVEEVAKRIRDAEKADAVDDGRLLRALHRFQVCEQERIARRARLLRDHLRSVAQPHRIADGGDLAARGGEQPMHGDTAREIREARRRLLDVAGVDVDHPVLGLGTHVLDDRGDARERVDVPVDVVRVQKRDAHAAATIREELLFSVKPPSAA